MRRETIFTKKMNFKPAIYWPPLVVFVVLFAVTLAVFFGTRTDIKQEQDIAIEQYAQSVKDGVEKRLILFGESLYAGSAFFQVSGDVTHSEWVEYKTRKGTVDRFSGAQGIGYAVVIPRDKLGEYNAQTKNDVYPSGDRDVYTAIRYIYPENERNVRALGYDMFSDDTRRVAMEKARDSGGVFMTDAVRLVQEDGENEQKGILVYAAHYDRDVSKASVEEKRDALVGYYYAVFRMQDFISNALAAVPELSEATTNVAVSVYSGDGGDNNLLYRSENYDEVIPSSTNTVTSSLGIYGSQLTFGYDYLPDGLVSEATRDRAQTVLVFGVFASALISAVILLLLRIKSNELALAAQQNTNEAKDSLLSIASHQLRTPATGVKQYIGMVLQGFSGDISDKQRAMLEKAYDSNERQLRTINDVLYLARLDSGRIVLSKAEIELNQLVRSVVDEQQDAIKENQHDVSVKLPRKKVFVEGDEHMIRMCIENLLSNAVKYTPSKGKIAVALHVKDNKVQIDVKDNGVGITQKDQEELLFRQFSRISNELTKSVSGTGIGLYIVKHLIEMHGGSVTVTSDEETGSTFSLSIPKKSTNR